jgi:hypothetical protein
MERNGTMAFTKSEQAYIYNKVVTRQYAEISDWTLAGIAEKFHDFAEEYGVDLDTVEIDIEAENGWYDEPATFEVFLVSTREPTEKEVEERSANILAEKKRNAEAKQRQKKAQEEHDRKEYARLHKKYGARAGVSAAE